MATEKPSTVIKLYKYSVDQSTKLLKCFFPVERLYEVISNKTVEVRNQLQGYTAT